MGFMSDEHCLLVTVYSKHNADFAIGDTVRPCAFIEVVESKTKYESDVSAVQIRNN